MRDRVHETHKEDASHGDSRSDQNAGRTNVCRTILTESQTADVEVVEHLAIGQRPKQENAKGKGDIRPVKPQRPVHNRTVEKVNECRAGTAYLQVWIHCHNGFKQSASVAD